MKRKRNSEQLQAFDVVLVDANGRTVRAHRALLMDKSEYFASVLNDHNLKELQLNENHLIELIRYLYRHDSDYGEPQVSGATSSPPPPPLLPLPPPPPLNAFSDHENELESGAAASAAAGGTIRSGPPSRAQSISPSDVIPPTTGDIEILMKLLVLSRKYCFKQLYRSLTNEINYKLGPATATIVYRFAVELEAHEFLDQTRLMILSWLPRIQTMEEFLNLPESAIRDIFNFEEPEIESESKLDALSAWWSHNKDANMTDLWVKIMMSTNDDG